MNIQYHNISESTAMRNQDLILDVKLTEKQLKQQKIIAVLEEEVFSELGMEYQVRNISIGEEEQLHTVFLPCKQQSLQNKENFFIGHGFGASSLMLFPVIGHLLTKGNVILCQLRGMGLNIKPKNVEIEHQEDILDYFLDGFEHILTAYNIKNVTYICHSFSAYLTLLLTIKREEIVKKYIKQLLLLSPVGLTPKDEDYKRQINGCSDFVHWLMHKMGWCFKLTYKSPLRSICSCCKTRLIMNSLEEQNLSKKEKELQCKILQALVGLPDGSQHLFYEVFEPRVLPKLPIEPSIKTKPIIPIVIVYGGQNDWVDRIGAQRMSKRYPDMITLVQIPGITHNIALHTIQCKQLFQQLFK